MGYTKHVDKESRNSESTQPTDLLFLFYPPLFCEMTENAPAPFPYGPGRFPAFAGAVHL